MITVDQLKRIERRLDFRATQLMQEIAAACPRAEELEPAQVGDAKEVAELDARTVVADAEVERDLAELRDVRAARQRIGEGGYGTCLDCGNDIDPRRLLAQPQTLRCPACQAEAETTVAGTVLGPGAARAR